jgi:hypothetical protein
MFTVCCLFVCSQPRAETESEQRAKIADSSKRAFLQEQFSTLEGLSRTYRTKKSRTSSGLWKLTWFYSGIADALEEKYKEEERETALKQLDGIVTRWTSRYPSSPAANITRSSLLITHAWAYRGHSYASKVKPENWAPFHKYVALASANLEKTKSTAAVDPEWYEKMLEVALLESWDHDRFDSLFNEATAREPLFYQNYFVALEYLLPKWNGSLEEVEDFAQSATKKTSAKEGRGMYARIYWYASQSHFQNNLFEDSKAVWPRMKEGFDDVVAKYPDAWNLNHYAKFACLANDKATAKGLLERISSTIVAEAWQPPSLLKWCTDRMSKP